MLHKRRVLVCLAVATVCLAGIALAKAVKQELVNEDGEEIGQAILNYAKGANKTECQVNCWDMEPETEYTALVCECDDDGEIVDCIELGSFTTNKKGKGNLHASVEGDVSNWCVVLGTEGTDGLATPCGAVPGVDWDELKKALLPGIVIDPSTGKPVEP